MNIHRDRQGKRSRQKEQTKFYKQPPYIIGLMRGNQVFYYLGAFHTQQPDHPQFGIFRLYWDEFVKNSPAATCITLVEGGKRIAGDTLEATTSREGEAGWVTWHSQRANITCDSPEPDEKQNTKKLIEEFGRDAVLHYYFVRQLDQWHRHDPLPDYQQYFSFIERWPTRYGVDGSLSIADLEQIHEKITGQTYDQSQANYFYELSNPHEKLAVTNEVSRRCTQLRDEYIVGQIKKYWDEGKSIFAVYGFSHVIDQEDELKRLLGV